MNDSADQECAHSEANSLGCPECGEEFDQKSEIFQWSDDGVLWLDGSEREIISARCNGYKTRTLYARPENEKVLLPDRKSASNAGWPQWTEKEVGWNEYRDEYIRLNGLPK